MCVRWYPWLRPHFNRLITSYQLGQSHHALIIQGIPGMGDDALIYAIMRFLLCLQPKKNRKSCGKCRGCQLMQAGTHPDYYLLEPKKGINTTVGIDGVRMIIDKLYKHSHLGDVKVVWIKNAKFLTETAANAFLKTLEEPPKNTWFFLSYLGQGTLPATLRSRCRLYYLNVPEENYALAWLRREMIVSRNVGLSALRLCSGSPGSALELLKGSHWGQRTQLYSELRNVLVSRDWLSLVTFLNHDRAPTYLQWIMTLFLDALKLQQGTTLITNVDNWLQVNNLASVLTKTTLDAIIYILCQYRKKLLSIASLNRELVLTDLLLIIEHYLRTGTLFPSPYF